MTDPAPGVEKAAPQPPQRKSRAGLVGLVVALLVVLGGGGAGYYYFLYLPGTPKAVLTEYFALEDRGDYQGTYRFLSEDSRKLFPEENWKAMGQMATSMRDQYTIEHTLGEPTRTGDRCRIPVTTKATMKPGPGRPSRSDSPASATVPFVLVKEKTGWKVDLIEQSKELMRQQGYSEKDIEKATKALEQMSKQSHAEDQP